LSKKFDQKQVHLVTQKNNHANASIIFVFIYKAEKPTDNEDLFGDSDEEPAVVETKPRTASGRKVSHQR